MSAAKVIGYFAAAPNGLFCKTKALVVAGSHATLKQACKLEGVAIDRIKIMKTTYGQIQQGMQMGGAYAFDKEAYARFSPLAATAGLPKSDFDFTPSSPGTVKFLILEPRRP